MPFAFPLDRRAGRLYFAVQALAGAAWWTGVFLSTPVREATIGALDPVLLAIVDIPLFVLASALVAIGVRGVIWVVAPWTALVTAGMVLYAAVSGQAGWGALLMIAATVGSIGAALLVRLNRLPTEWIIVGPFAFRLADPAETRRHVTRTFGQIVAFWGLFLAVLPAIIVFVEHRWQVHLPFPAPVRISGIVLLAAASALGIWSATSMSTQGDGTPLPSAMPRRLVVAGPYRYVRNPMALAGIAQGVAVGLIAESWLVVVYALAGSLVWNWIVRPLEEADLEARFGGAYVAYRESVTCWVPRFPRG